MKTFPLIKDLVTDVSWNYEVKKAIPKFKPRTPDAPDGTWRMQQEDVDRVQEFRKCIECFLCQDVCHVLRDHHMHDEFIGPRFFVHSAASRCTRSTPRIALEHLRKEGGIGLCNITKCCTKVCPEHIHITDNAIIPLKERVVDRFYDPVEAAVHPQVFGGQGSPTSEGSAVMIELKRISQAALPAALAKAERYRLLNEPEQAESICRDVLAVEPTNQTALVTLLLALTDQFGASSTTSVRRAEEVLAQIGDEYQRIYYAGIIRERWALALLAGGDPGRQAYRVARRRDEALRGGGARRRPGQRRRHPALELVRAHHRARAAARSGRARRHRPWRRGAASLNEALLRSRRRSSSRQRPADVAMEPAARRRIWAPAIWRRRADAR